MELNLILNKVFTSIQMECMKEVVLIIYGMEKQILNEKMEIEKFLKRGMIKDMVLL